MAIEATDAFSKLVERMSILTANKVGLNVEVVEQVDQADVVFKHEVSCRQA